MPYDKEPIKRFHTKKHSVLDGRNRVLCTGPIEVCAEVLDQCKILRVKGNLCETKSHKNPSPRFSPGDMAIFVLSAK